MSAPGPSITRTHPSTRRLNSRVDVVPRQRVPTRPRVPRPNTRRAPTSSSATLTPHPSHAYRSNRSLSRAIGARSLVPRHSLRPFTRGASQGGDALGRGFGAPAPSRRGLLVRARYGKGGRQDVDAIIKERDDARAQLSVAQQALKTANDRLGSIESGDGDRARLQQELDRAVDQLHDAQRDADDARRQAREAEELFAAAADERAAKVKELVQEIDHWHDAAETAQRMEAEARSELEEARNRVRELESRSGDMESQRNQAGEQQAEMSRRAEDAERRLRESEKRTEDALHWVEEKEQEANRLRGELEGLKTALEATRKSAGSKEGEVAELRRQADEAKAAAFKAEQSLRDAAKLTGEISKFKPKIENLEGELNATRGNLEDRTAELHAARKELEELRGRAERAEESAKRADEKRKNARREMEERIGQLEEEVSKKEWYLGETRAELADARGALERSSGMSDEARRTLEAAREAQEKFRLQVKEKDEEIRLVRSQLAEARLALESVAEGADMATNEASEQLRVADGRIQEAWAAKELVDAELERITRELESARATIANDDSAGRLRIAAERLDEAWAAKEEKDREVENVRAELTEARRLAAEAERAASLRVHEAEHRADTLKRAFESKEAEVSRMRGEMLEARSAALEVAATGDEAREKFLRAEERAKAAAEDAKAAAINASEKLEAAKQAAKDAAFPAEKVRDCMTKLVDAEGQIGGAAAAKDEKFEELKAARAELAKARSKVTDVAREATARVEEANDKLREAETALAATDNHLGRIVRDLGKIADEIERCRRMKDTDTVYRLEEHQAQGFRARDDKTREVERLKTELEVTRREASDVSNKAALKVRESEQTIAQAKSLVHQREMEMGERRARLEEIRSATTASAAAYDKAAQQQLKAEEKSKAVSASAQRAAVTAVEKMRVAAEAAAAAYDAAAERERILRDELAKSGGDAGGQTDVARMRQLASIKEKITWSKQAADYAHDMEEARKASATAADNAQRRLRELEDRMDELKRSIKMKMAEGTVHEELEHERATSRDLQRLEEERRAASVAAAEAGVQLRQAQDTSREMQAKIARRERELTDAKRDIDRAVQEAEEARKENQRALEAERKFARAKSEQSSASLGGRGGGGGGDDEEIAQMRRQLEEGDRELSWMRGQLEEAKHTVMRAAELEQQRRKAADEFKRDQQQASAFGYGQGSGQSQQQQQQQQPARPLDFGGRPPPTRETLMEREKELSQLRAALDEAGNEVVANLRKYDEMYAQLDGLYGAEREQLTERLSKGHEYIEGLKAAADEKKAAVADMERRVAAIKDALAQLSATQQDSTYGPQSGAPAPYGGSSSHHQPPQQQQQQQQQSSSSGGSARSGASAEAIQYALEEAEFVLREAKRRANDLEASFQDKERGLTQMRRDLADREQRKSLSSSSSYDYGGSGDAYGSGGGDIEEQRRAAAMAAVEASYAARAAEERANMLRGSLDDKSGELEWMRSEHAKVVAQIATLEASASAAADTQRKVDAKASSIVEESRRAEEARRAAAAARDPYPDRNVDAQREADLAEQLRAARVEFDQKASEATEAKQEAVRAAADRDRQIEEVEFLVAGVPVQERERITEGDAVDARYSAEDTATASYRLRQVQDRFFQMEALEGNKGRVASSTREEVEQARQKAMTNAAAAEQATEKLMRAEKMREDATTAASAAAVKARAAEETAEDAAQKTKEAAAERERNLRDELAQAAAAVRDRNASIENLEATVTELERRTREATFEAKKAAAKAEQVRSDAAAAADAAAHEAANTERRLEGALNRAERELKAMEEAMLKELTSSELHLAETEETASSYSQSIKKLTHELESERRRADDLADELKRAKARMAAAEAAAATQGAYYGAGDEEGDEGKSKSLLSDEEVEDLRTQIEELELTLAEVMSEGVNSTVGDRATGKLMSHIKALQEKVREGRELKLLSETMLAEQARLREEAEEAKFYRDEAAKRWEDAEDLAGQLHQQLSRAGIDPGRELMDRMRNRPKALTDASPSSSARSPQQVNGAAVPPEIAEIQRKLLDTEEDVSQLMAEIMQETVEVEMATANAELASLKNEIFSLKQRLGEA